MTAEYDGFVADCVERLKALQNRTTSPTLPTSVKELRERVRVTLQKALRAGLLKTAHHDIFRLLSPVSPSEWRGESRSYEFSCGAINDELKDPNSRDCLVRDDEAVLSFSVTVGEKSGQATLELIAYRFDLTFPTDAGIPFIRFDLDAPNKGHAKDGLRAHIHPGLAEGRLPSAILDPVEAIHFLLVHLRQQ